MHLHGEHIQSHDLFSPVMMITRLMKETRTKPIPPGHETYTLVDKWHGILHIPSHTDTAGHTKAFIFTQSHRHGWTYQGLCLPSHTDTAGHTKAFIYPVTQTRLDIPRPFFTQSHRHGWTYQGLYLPSHTDTAGHTKAFLYPVTQTRLDIPRPLFTQSHRHGWTYQGLYLPSHTDTAGHTKAFLYPVTQTRLDIPRPLFYPVTQTRLDIPRPFFTQSHRHGWTYTKAFIYPIMDHYMGEVNVLRHKAYSNRRPVSPQSNTPTTRPR